MRPRIAAVPRAHRTPPAGAGPGGGVHGIAGGGGGGGGGATAHSTRRAAAGRAAACSGAVTLTFSLAVLQAPATGRLFASPSYVATHRYTPTAVGVYAADVAVAVVPDSATVWTLVNTGVPLQFVSAGAYRRNVTVAPATGLTRPVTVA